MANEEVVLYGVLARKCWETFIVSINGVETRFSHILNPAEDFRFMRIGDKVKVTAIEKPKGELIATWLEVIR